MSNFALLDWAVVVVYFVVVFVVAVYASWKERKGSESSADYFLAGRDAGWFLVGGSLFASSSDKRSCRIPSCESLHRC